MKELRLGAKQGFWIDTYLQRKTLLISSSQSCVSKIWKNIWAKDMTYDFLAELCHVQFCCLFCWNPGPYMIWNYARSELYTSAANAILQDLRNMILQSCEVQLASLYQCKGRQGGWTINGFLTKLVIVWNSSHNMRKEIFVICRKKTKATFVKTRMNVVFQTFQIEYHLTGALTVLCERQINCKITVFVLVSRNYST